MNAEDAIRFLHHEARACRDRDAHEAFCLLMPAMLRVLELPAMSDAEADAFRYHFKEILRHQSDARSTARV